MEEADGRFGHGDASMVAHAFLEQHFCKIGHGEKSQNSVELLQQAMVGIAEKMFSYCFLVRSKRKARPKETGNTRTKNIFLCFHIRLYSFSSSFFA